MKVTEVGGKTANFLLPVSVQAENRTGMNKIICPRVSRESFTPTPEEESSMHQHKLYLSKCVREHTQEKIY